MEFEVPWEWRELRASVRRFVEEELIPLESKVPDADDIPDDLRERLEQKARASGFWGLDMPVDLGGAGLGYLPMCLVWEELGRSVLVPFRAPGLFGRNPGPVLLKHSTPDQRERYLIPLAEGRLRTAFAITEPDAGSDPAAMKTSAVRNGDHWVLNGTKTFISGGLKADFFQVFARTEGAEGRTSGPPVTCFLVDRDTPGFEIGQVYDLIIGETPVELVLRDCRVPDANRVGEVGQGLRLAKSWFTAGRLRHGPFAIGLAQRALEMATTFASQRVTFGQPLAERQAVQIMLADSAVEIHAARLMTHQCAWRLDQGADGTTEAAMVKLHADEMAYRVVDRAIQIFGGVGLSRELPLERMLRDLRSRRITEGASEIQRIIIARALLKQGGRV